MSLDYDVIKKAVTDIFNLLKRPRLEIILDADTPHIPDVVAFYHIKVLNNGGRNAKACVGTLLSVRPLKDLNTSDQFRKRETLKWANEVDFLPKDIYYDSFNRLDLVYCKKNDDTFHFCVDEDNPSPGNTTVFGPGEYEIKLRVQCDEPGKSVNKSFRIINNGSWNKLKIEEI